VGAGGDDEIGGTRRRGPERRCRAAAVFADRGEGAVDLELLDIFGEVAARHALVDVLVAGEVAERVDAGLHIVPGDPLAGVDEARSIWSMTRS
jgi:hypothetical protein